MEGIKTMFMPPFLREHDSQKLAAAVADARKRALKIYKDTPEQHGKTMIYKLFFEIGDVYYEYVFTFSIQTGDLNVEYQGVEAITDVDIWLDRILAWGLLK